MFPVTERQHVAFPSRRLCAALITITGLSIFMTRVDANANDLAQASTEVHWPAGYSPRTADVYSHNEVVIHASPSTAWRVIRTDRCVDREPGRQLHEELDVLVVVEAACRAALAGMPVRVGRTDWPLTMIGHGCIIHM